MKFPFSSFFFSIQILKLVGWLGLYYGRREGEKETLRNLGRWVTESKYEIFTCLQNRTHPNLLSFPFSRSSHPFSNTDEARQMSVEIGNWKKKLCGFPFFLFLRRGKEEGVDTATAAFQVIPFLLLLFLLFSDSTIFRWSLMFPARFLRSVPLAKRNFRYGYGIKRGREGDGARRKRKKGNKTKLHVSSSPSSTLFQSSLHVGESIFIFSFSFSASPKHMR